MKILAIETSCDETALALVEAQGGLKGPRFKILKNLISSQIKIHRPFGGVVPMLAKREHQKNLPVLLRRIMNKKSRIKQDKSFILNSRYLIPDLIAVTVGPGLDPALWAGIEFAQKLAEELKKPLIGANHLEGHLYSFLLAKPYSLNPKPSLVFPAIALIVSGGHTILLKMDSLTKWEKLGETRDDAAGEAFDKVARLLGLSYPGGPELEKLAIQGNPQAINFPRPMLKDKNYDFSFSGLKTSVLYYLRDLGYSQKPKANSNLITDVAASFQQAVIDVLVGKTFRATKEFGARSVMLSGGVAANKLLRKTFEKEIARLNSSGRFRVAGAANWRRRAFRVHFFVPPFKFNTDNAVMIALAAYIRHLRGKKLKIASQPNLNL